MAWNGAPPSRSSTAWIRPPVGVSSPVSTHSTETPAGQSVRAANAADQRGAEAGEQQDPAHALGGVDRDDVPDDRPPPDLDERLGQLRDVLLQPRPAAAAEDDRSVDRRILDCPAVTDAIFKAYDIRGLYGEQIDGDVAEQIGRAFARVLGGLRGKPVRELRIGLGRDMRLTAPELAARYRAGMVAEGAHVLDAGMVGTEMLYFLVGSRELDGGLMCTASHNPKAYTGAKLVREGALALSGDAGIGDIRDLVLAGLPAPEGPPGSAEDVDVYAAFQARALEFVDPDAIRPLKVVLDGGNGMAGPMVGPILERLPALELVPTYWAPDGSFPDHEPNPLLPENRSFVIDKVRSEGADLGIAWDGDADRCFFIDGDGAFVDGDFLTALLARVRARDAPGRGDPLRRPRVARGRRHRAGGGRRAAGQPRRPRVLQGAHARGGRRVRRRGLRPLLLRRLLQRGLGHAARAADPRAARPKSGRTLAELLAPYRERYFISGEINSEVADPHGADRGDPRPLRRRRRSPSSTASPSTTTTGTSTCGCRTPSRCCACASRASSRTPTWRPGATRCSP